MILSADGKPVPDLQATLLEVVRAAGPDSDAVRWVIERLANPPVTVMVDTGLLNARGEQILREAKSESWLDTSIKWKAVPV